MTNAKLSDIINKLICGDAGIGRQASLRCLCQYWRVGSSPISRTSVKDIRFSSVLYFYIRQISKALSAKKPHWNRTKSLISWKRNLFRSQTGKLEVLVSVLACGFKSHFPHHKRNLFCLPRQERFFLDFWAKYKANHRKMGFGAVDRLLRSPIFCFQRQKQSENAGVHIEFLCFASNH